MGDWNITIRGTGCHHNGSKTIDANLAAADFVRKLIAQGHTIKSATVTHGGEDNVADPDAYEATYAKTPDPYAKP